MHKMRAEISKDDEIRYISHLDYARAIERAVRRANLPVAYSEGFNPHMKIAFASAMAVGITSETEYLDIELREEVTLEHFYEALSGKLPAGIRLKQVRSLQQKSQALMALVNLAQYSIVLPLAAEESFTAIETAVHAFNQALAIFYTRESPKKGKKEIDVKVYMEQDIVAERQEDLVILHLSVRITPLGSIKPGEVLTVLIEQFGLKVMAAAALIHRTGLFVTDGKALVSPFDAE